jgi:NTP pyrophosphatase (non-canonical NTP hydrolase)
MEDIEQHIRTYLQERGWDHLRPSDVAKSISIEAAELLEVFQWSSLTIEETQADPRRMEQIKKELADVLIYALDLAVLLELDTKDIILQKLEHIKKKFPAELMRKSAQEGPGSGNDPLYLKIKQDYRRRNLS